MFYWEGTLLNDDSVHAMTPQPFSISGDLLTGDRRTLAAYVDHYTGTGLETREVLAEVDRLSPVPAIRRVEVTTAPDPTALNGARNWAWKVDALREEPLPVSPPAEVTSGEGDTGQKVSRTKIAVGAVGLLLFILGLRQLPSGPGGAEAHAGR